MPLRYAWKEPRLYYYDGRYKDLIVVLDPYEAQLFKNLSDGQRIMLTLVADLASRAAILNPHLTDAALRETPGIVIIDELDRISTQNGSVA